jgi:hypothetical protein
MSKPLEKKLEGREEEVIQAVHLYGKFKAMDIFGIKSYVAFNNWWEKHKLDQYSKKVPDASSKSAKKARKSLSKNRLAYIAAGFDTEIGFGIQRYITQSQGYHYRLELRYTKMERNILSYLSKIFGGKVRKVKDQPIYKHDHWNWELSPRETYLALNKVYPYLRLKKELARICIAFYKCYHLPDSISSQHSRTIEPAILATSDKLYAEYLNYIRLHPGGLRFRPSIHKEVEQYNGKQSR